MHAQSDKPHVYTRKIHAQEHTSLNALSSLIRPGSRVLDLGCGVGALGEWLHTHKQCVLDGMTLSEDEATQAAPHYQRVEVGNLETAHLATLFGGNTYDYIVCADVLEHLPHPERVLPQCQPLLRDGGQLLVSVPNAAYCGLVGELLQGRFDYREEGLLDKTHLRFFTRSTLLAFLAQNRWNVRHIEPVERDVLDSEFDVAFDTLPPAVSRYLRSAPDALSYQFVVAAEPLQTTETLVPPPKPPRSAQVPAQFNAELFLGTTHGYSQHHKLTTRGQMGTPRQTLSFDIPPHSPPWTSLRLDPADRPGFLHLHNVRLRTTLAPHHTLWSWQPGDNTPDALTEGTVPCHQIHWQLPGAISPTPTLTLLGEDPWLELPVPAVLLNSPQSLVLEVSLGWPMSADHLVAAQTIGQMATDKAHLQANVLHLTQQLKQSNAAFTQELAVLNTSVTQLQGNNAQILATLAARDRAHTSTQQALTELQNHLRWIENSTVFKVTRPLVRLKMALTRTATSHAMPGIPAPQSTQVDVIVPVYKGLEDTRRCIQSALASPCQTPFRLIVLNDASPEPEVTQWLREIAPTDPRITLIENPENLGFVATVNRGMTHSTHNDVVLLNSDTEVANNWLDRIRATAYSFPRAGTVTPLSNNATICSYPRFCQANPLVADQTTASLDTLCATTHPGAAVDVPTGVGFCMYIRRDCLSAVGLFDVANFGKGYGEENDFCRRAHATGWRNLLALDTFVLHAGGVSFGDSKSTRELTAMETLRRLHPDYEAEVMRFIQADPAQPYRHAIDLARLKTSPLPKILAVTHDRAGGTLRHVKELAQALQTKAHFVVLSPAPAGRAILELPGQFEGMRLEFAIETQFDDLVLLLRAIDVSLVHYHHLLGHHPRVQALPTHLGVPFDFTAHDHYSQCPQISLTDATNRYCGETGNGEGPCHTCLQRSPAPGGVDIETWRANHQVFLGRSRHILAPSQDTAQRMQRFLPTANVKVAPHTDLAPNTPLAVPAPRPTRNPDAALKVVVLGALSNIKGADLLEEVAILAAAAQAPVEFHLVGYAYRSLKTRPRTHLSVHGEYTEVDLPNMLEWLQPDVVWFPALWPETYSYTLSACLQLGLPVVAPNLGAFPERLGQRPWSWVQPWDQPATDWLSFFQRLQSTHFAHQIPPTLPPAATTSGPNSDHWDYATHYLPQSASALPTGGPTPPLPHAQWLHSFRPGRTPPGMQGLATGMRRRALGGLVRLRSAPLLRGLAQAIPLRWQTRAKSWLMR